MPRACAKIFPVFLVIFVLLIAPAFYFAMTRPTTRYTTTWASACRRTWSTSSPTSKLSEEFDIASTHMLLVNARPAVEATSAAMIDDMEQVDGVKYVLGLEAVVGPMHPQEMLPDSVRSILKSDQWELLLINSEYKVATDDVDQQIDQLNAILKKYDRRAECSSARPPA